MVNDDIFINYYFFRKGSAFKMINIDFELNQFNIEIFIGNNNYNIN